MHGMHARLPKNFVLEDRLRRYRDYIELDAPSWARHWAAACRPLDPAGNAPYTEVRLDLGCGKGSFIVESAAREPGVLFLGVDAEPLCVAYTAQRIAEQGLKNAVVIPGTGEQVHGFFGPGELSCIHLNFPTPYPRKKEAKKRLVILERLLEYRGLLKEGGTVRLRTDSQPLRDFALTQLAIAGFEVVWSSDDERSERPGEPTSEYEERLTAQGARVYGLWATPSGVPSFEQRAPLGLVDYLPEDLFAGGYIPYGMEGTITNLRNQQIRRKASKTGGQG